MSDPQLDAGTRLLARWVTFCSRRAAWVAAWALFTMAAALFYTARNISITTDRDAMLSAELPFRVNHERFKREFPQFQDNLVVVVTAQNPELARRAAKALGARLEALPDLFRDVYVPKADPFLERHGLLYLGLEDLRELSDRLAQIQPFLGRLTHDPSLRGLFTMLREAVEARTEGREIDLGPIVTRLDDAARATLAGEQRVLSWQALLHDDDSLDSRRQFLLLQPQLDYGTLLPGKPAMDAVRRAAAELELDPAHGVRVRMTGGVALGDEELGSVMDGAWLIATLVAVSVGLVLWFGLRSRRLVLASVLTLAIGLSWTAAFAIAAIGHLNLISVAFAILYLGLGADYAIHVSLRYREVCEKGWPHLVALQTTAADVGGSIFLCAITTALGFYAFVPTSYSGVSELGLISGTGMFISFIATMTLLPAWLTLLKPTFGAPIPKRELGWVTALLELPFRRRRAVLWITACLAVGSLPLLATVRFDSNPMNLRSPRSESVATFRELLATSKTPPWSLQVLERDPSEVAADEQAISALAVVEKAVTLEDYVPKEQDEKLDILEDAAWVVGSTLELATDAEPPGPGERAQATRELVGAFDAYLASENGRGDRDARSLRDGLAEVQRRASPRPEDGGGGGDETLFESLEEALLETLPDNLELLNAGLDAESVGVQDLPAELVARWKTSGGLQRIEVFPAEDLEAPGAMRAFVDAVRAVEPDVTGGPLMILESGSAVVGAFREAFLYALVATTLVLALLLRDLKDVCRVVGALLLAGLWTGASVALAGLEFNFANVIALPLLLGIGVDSGVHVLHRARLGLEDRSDILRSSTARAVVLSSLTTFCSFVNMTLSEHRGTASMGLLLTLGVCWTVVTSLVVLPALLGRPAGRPAPGPSLS